jgi:hypothetical protein
MKKRVAELQTEKEAATASLQSANAKLEQTVATLQTEKAVNEAALQAKTRGTNLSSCALLCCVVCVLKWLVLVWCRVG